MKSISINAPAKVNIVLRVLGKRPDGYHDLFMVMEKLSLCDDITLEEIPSGIKLEIEGESDAGMIAEKNLVCRAAKAFQEKTGEDRGVKIHLTKRIPIAAGLGGGSSDAAAVLKGLNKLWQKDLGPDELAKMGARLGGDVPFFCYDGPAIAQGIGDRITQLPRLPNLLFLLINPGFSVSTPWVYGEFDRQYLPGAGEVELPHPSSPYKGEEFDLKLTLKSKDASYRSLFKEFRDVTLSLENDLEKVTIARYPEIGEIKSYLVNHGAVKSLMSGSGPTVFGIFEDEKTRNSALEKITKKNWKVFATHNFLA